MLKKTLVGFSFAICVMPFASAYAANDGSGCGLGQLILEGKSGKGANIGAAILNNAIFPQTSAMSTGTMGCDTSKTVQNTHERDIFVAQNRDNLNIDMAQGQGDYLTSLAYIMGINEKDTDSFYRLTQAKFEELNEPRTAQDMLAKLDDIMINDKTLSKYVQ